tara:strand:- start:3109 stop:4053 length:945 start_codon:yes stop_codon:yes gene_type:complete
MKYLLIDFGASYIKTIVYNKKEDSYSNNLQVPSPFLNKNIISKKEILEILESIVSQNKDIFAIVACSILGGYYKNDIYYSWKELRQEKNHCLISGLFSKLETYHIHDHHKKTTVSETYEIGLKVLGSILGIPIYSALGDTMCVIESLNIGDNDIAINMGTGSQIITKNSIKSYIPSGRAFLTFNELFKSVGLDIFDLLKSISIQDVIDSNLTLDLNVFEQSHLYSNGGSISNIKEGSFNIKNLLGSILKEYVNQYKQFISQDKKNIILTGGIPKKLIIIESLFRLYYPKMTIICDKSNIENTHMGLSSYIKKYL